MAAHNDLQHITQSNIATAAKNELCSFRADDVRSQTVAGGGLSIIGLGSANGRFGTQQATQMQSNVCNSGSQSLDSNTLDLLLQKVVNNDAVQAWSTCMNNNGHGLRSLIERNGDVLILRLWWVANFNVSTVTVVDSDITGVTGACAQTHWPGTGLSIGSGQIIKQCQWDRQSAVTFTVNTNGGGTVFTMPPPVSPSAVRPSAVPAQKPDFERCVVDSDIEACKRATEAEKQKCFGEGDSSACTHVAQAQRQTCSASDFRCQQQAACVGALANDLKLWGDRNCRNNAQAPECLPLTSRINTAQITKCSGIF
jgi:hypothetical protein